jgi:hypothetical protein
MARDHTARARIQQYLSSAGPIDDPSGYASKVLRERIDYQGSAVAFIQLIAAMEQDGEIVRKIRGKRTYRISASKSLVGSATAPAAPSPTSPIPSAPAAAGIEIDYDRLARAIVREFWIASAGSGPLGVGAQRSNDAAAEQERIAAQRDDYARRLELARDQLNQLLDDAELPEHAG